MSRENEKTYHAYLCSRVPNNECALCSNFVPEYVGQTSPMIHEWALGYHGFDKCPSCQRAVYRVFVCEGMPIPKQVPSDFPFKFPSEVICGHFNTSEYNSMAMEMRLEFLMKTKPLEMRSDLDWELRNEKLKEYVSAYRSGDSSRISKVNHEEPNQIPVERGKEVKRKLKF